MFTKELELFDFEEDKLLLWNILVLFSIFEALIGLLSFIVIVWPPNKLFDSFCFIGEEKFTVSKILLSLLLVLLFGMILLGENNDVWFDENTIFVFSFWNIDFWVSELLFDGLFICPVKFCGTWNSVFSLLKSPNNEFELFYFFSLLFVNNLFFSLFDENIVFSLFEESNSFLYV